MVNFFTKKSSLNIILLFIYAIIVKSIFFLHPKDALINLADGVFYKNAVLYINSHLKNPKIFYSILAFLLYFIQALILSNLAIKVKLFQKPNYLIGMVYLLITSFIPEWNAFSSALVANTFMLSVWSQIFSMQNAPKPKAVLFNLGLVICLCNFIFSFSFIFLILVVIGLLTYRPFKLNEYVVLLLGYLVPIYCWIVFDFLRDSLAVKNYLLRFPFKLPTMAVSQWLFAGIFLILSILLVGIMYVQNETNRMPIQSRKSWSIVFFWVIISLFMPFFTADIRYWVLCLMPISAFGAAMFYYIKAPRAKTIIHWSLLAFACFVLYFKK